MSILFDRLKKDQLNARRNKESDVKISVLTTLIGEVSKKAKDDGNREVSDLDVIKTVKSFIDNANIVLNVASDTESAKEEISILSEYLPKQLTKEEIQTIIVSGQFSNLGQFMKYMKENHAGLYDGAMAKTVFESK